MIRFSYGTAADLSTAISQVKSCLRCKYTAIEHTSINKA